MIGGVIINEERTLYIPTEKAFEELSRQDLIDLKEKMIAGPKNDLCEVIYSIGLAFLAPSLIQVTTKKGSYDPKLARTFPTYKRPKSWDELKKAIDNKKDYEVEVLKDTLWIPFDKKNPWINFFSSKLNDFRIIRKYN